MTAGDGAAADAEAIAAAETAPLEERAARYLALHAELLARLGVTPAE